MQSNWLNAFALMLKSEGGYVNNPADPGGMTNLGVTKATWENWVGRESDEAEMRGLTPEKLSLCTKRSIGMPCVGMKLKMVVLHTFCLISP